MRLTRALAATLLLALALIFGARGEALAHAALVRAEPADGSRLAQGPGRVRLTFSEPLEPALARLTLVGPSGAAVLAAVGDPRDVYAVVAPVEEHLAPGAYRVEWRVVSADGHPVAGSVQFVVGGAAGGATAGAAEDASAAGARPAGEGGADAAVWGPAVAGAPLVPAVLRAITLGCLTALAGLLAFAVRPGAGGGRAAAGGLVTGLAGAGALSAVLHAAAWAVNAAPDHQLAGDGAQAVLASGAGHAELWRAGLALLALWGVALARRPALGLGFAVAALAAGSAAGHAAAVHPLVAVPTKALHLAAAALWLGGLLWLLAALRAAGDARALAAAAGRVSAAALVAAAVVTATGALQAWLFVPSWAALAGSAYGRVALAKTAGLLGLVAFGAQHRYRSLPRLAGPAAPDADDLPNAAARRRALARTLRGEVVLMAAVVLLSGVLAYLPTPAAPAAGLTQTGR